jgi:uncharacterized protein (TIGR02145 family)
MGKSITTILCIFLFCGLSLAQIMNIHTASGTDAYNLTDIDSITFTAAGDTGIVIDIDGNVYRTVRIGTQVWLMENLKVTRYLNGNALPNVTDGTQWSTFTSGAYCNYNNDPNNADIYGRLYNWFAVDDPRGIAPAGWHVATDADWQILVNFLGGEMIAGGALKDTILWAPPNTDATNSSGFSWWPGGVRDYLGNFGYIGEIAFFWSSTEAITNTAFCFYLSYNNAQVTRGFNYNPGGLSVRCVRD